MSRAAAAAAVALVALAATLALHAAPAGAAPPPRHFFGMSGWGIPGQRAFQRMGQGRVGTYRLALHWSHVEPTPGRRNWLEFDTQVSRAANNGMSILAVLHSAPPFVSRDARVPPTGPTGRKAYAEFAAAAVKRYGPNGTWWKAHPNTPKRAIRRWVLWNEPNAAAASCRTSTGCAPRVSASNYRLLVEAASKAIRAVDRDARVSLAGMAQTSRGVSIERYLRQLYAYSGFKAHFDAVSLHPYAADHTGVEAVVKSVRSLMNADGRNDANTPIWLTEVGWGTAGNKGNKSVTTYAGQATRLRNTFNMAVNRRARYHLQLIIWFSLQDRPPTPAEKRDGHWQPHTGLFTQAGSAKPAWSEYVRRTGGSAGKGSIGTYGSR